MYNLTLPTEPNARIQAMISYHKTNKLGKYKRLKNYYEGKHDILNRTMSDDTKPNNKVVTPFPSYIVNTISGYLLGQPVKYKDAAESNALDIIQPIFDSNDEEDKNVKLIRTLSTCGEAFELIYFNEASELRFAQLDNEQTLVHYSNLIEPEIDVVLRYIEPTDPGDNITIAELYYADRVEHYQATGGGTFTLVDSIPHYFKKVPVVHYINNDETMGDFEKAMSLIDDYDKVLSDNANEIEYTRNCYLLMYGFGDIDNDTLKRFKEAGAFLLPDASDGADVKFLTKDADDTVVQNQLKVLRQNIHNLSGIPDLSDESFAGNSSGVAIEQKLLGLKLFMAEKERKFNRGLYKRLALIANGLALKSIYVNTLPITAQYVSSIPQNLVDLSTTVKNLAGIIPNADLLSILPQSIVADPQKSAEEMDKASVQSTQPATPAVTEAQTEEQKTLQ